MKTKTDNTGQVVVNLPLNKAYKIKAIAPKSFQEDSFILHPADEGQTHIKRTIHF